MYTPEAISYWDFLKSKGSKTLIDQETFDFCNTGVELIKTNKQVCDLIGCNVSEFENKEIFNELPLSCKINGRPFGLKGIVDNLVIDHDKKVININDIKTSSKDLKDFSETIEFYNYWMQAAIYSTIIAIKFINLIEEGYSLNFHFIVIDKNYQVYPFKVSEPTLNSWFTRLSAALEEANWHYNNKSYDLPYKFATGQVTL